MVQLILHTDAISGFQAAIAYLWQQQETFVRLGICFLCEPGVGAQAIHVTAGIDGSLGGAGGVSFVIDTPFVDFPGQAGLDNQGHKGTSCIYVELHSNTLGPLVTILEHSSHHLLIIEFGRQQDLWMKCTRYLTLSKNKKATDVNYVIAQVVLSTQTLTYNITALQYLETIVTTLNMCTPLLSFARRNGGCNPVASALSLRQIIHSFTCLTASLPSIYPEVMLQLLVVDLADVSSFTRTVLRTGVISGSSNSNTGTTSQITLSVSQNTMNEEETRELGEGLNKTCPQLANYIYHAQPEAELHLKDSAWAFVGKSILMLLTAYKLNITLFTSITTSLMKRVVERIGQDSTVSVSTQTLQLLEAVIGTQRPEGVLLAYDLYHFFRSSLRYIAFCLFLQSDSPFLSFLGISTPYPILSYDLCIDNAGQEFLASAFQSVQGNVYDATLRGLNVHVIRRIGTKAYGQLLLRDMANHIAIKVDGVFCRSKLPESAYPSTRVGSSLPFSGDSNPFPGGQDPRLISGTATLMQHPLPVTPTLHSTGYERLHEQTGLGQTVANGYLLDPAMQVIPDERLMRTPSLQTIGTPNASHRRLQEALVTDQEINELPQTSNMYPFHTPVLLPAGLSPGRLESHSLQAPIHSPTPHKSPISKTPLINIPSTMEPNVSDPNSESHKEVELQLTPEIPHEPNFLSLLLEPSNDDPEPALDLEAVLLQTRSAN